MDDWQETTISVQEMMDAPLVRELFRERGVPLGDDRYIRDTIDNKDGTYTYRWMLKCQKTT